MRTYRLSPAGRRRSLALLAGALLIWVFALWSFSSTLRISYNPLAFLGTLRASIAAGLGLGQVVPGLLLLALIVATPLLIWNLIEEWAAAYTPAPDGLRFESLGVQMLVPWPALRALRATDDDVEEPLDEILLAGDQSAQITNPLVRFLHRQGYGRSRLPIYPGIEDRDELIAAISAQIAPPISGPLAAGEPAGV